MIGARALLLASVVVLGVTAGAVAGHYVPKVGDSFAYTEAVVLSNGVGNYTGYSEGTYVNGTVAVTAVAANGTESATYSNSNHYANNTGASERWTSSGSFTFSAVTFHYVQGTDNQTGYTNPYVWFYMNNSLAVGSTFYLLNTGMKVVATAADYDLSGSYVKAIFAEGNGSFPRNDVYGAFTATYTWREWFDPSTGYVIAYLYTEHDSNPAGDGFDLTDSLAVTQTSYALTPGTAPPPPPSGGGSGVSVPLLLGVVAGVVLIAIVVAAVATRHRRRGALPRHSAHGEVGFTVPPVALPPSGTAPPPIHLTPSGQPAVQQIVIQETVKVNCRYCGALIDSTVAKCPFCGAART